MTPLLRLLYSAMLCLYPPALRREHGREMRQLFDAAIRAEGPGALFSRIAADAARSLPREWRDWLRERRGARHLFQPPPTGEPMRNIARDFQYAFRLLLRSPGFTTATVLTLALGIGANTAIFSLADAVILRPLRVAHPEQLVTIRWSLSYADYKDYSTRTDLFTGFAVTGGGAKVSVSIDGQTELVPAMYASGSYFGVLGVPAAVGRTLQPADEVDRSAPIVAVIEYGYWHSRFAGSPEVVGRRILINGRPVTIVGVVPRSFHGISLSGRPRIWMPATASPQLQTGLFAKVDPLTRRGFVWLAAVGRLRDGVTLSKAAAAIDAMYRTAHPPPPGRPVERMELRALASTALGGSSAADLGRFVALMSGVVGFSLLIACANLANMLLAKAAVRRREIAVRMALGASGARVAGLMLAESVLLSVIGGAAGLAVATASLGLLSRFQLPGNVPIEYLDLHLNGASLAMTVLLAVGTALIFGVMPAIGASRTDVVTALKDEARVTSGRTAARRALVVVQVALCLMLLVGGGLFLRSLQTILRVDLGYDVDPIATISVNLGLARYDEGRMRTFYTEGLRRIEATPGVQSASWATLAPMHGAWAGDVSVDGYGKAADEDMTVFMIYVGPAYFQTMGMHILAGRPFSPADRAGTAGVAIINESMAAKYWAGRPAVGGRFRGGFGAGNDWVQIVGVVNDARTQSVEERPVPLAYLAFNQNIKDVGSSGTHLLVRAKGDPDHLLPLIRDQLRSLDAQVPLYDLLSLRERLRDIGMTQRMGATLFGLFSALGVVLAAVGIYGVAAYLVAQRTREIGIRVALGAGRGHVLRLVLGQGLAPVAFGLVLGLGLSLWAARFAAAFLYGLSPSDPTTFVAVAVLLAGVSTASSYLPARRAARLDPMRALRES